MRNIIVKETFDAKTDDFSIFLKVSSLNLRSCTSVFTNIQLKVIMGRENIEETFLRNMYTQ